MIPQDHQFEYIERIIENKIIETKLSDFPKIIKHNSVGNTIAPTHPDNVLLGLKETANFLPPKNLPVKKAEISTTIAKHIIKNKKS